MSSLRSWPAPIRPRPLFGRALALVVAAAGGGILVLAFPSFGLWPLAAVGVGLLSLAVHGRNAGTGAWLGWAFGWAFCLPLLHWASVYVGAVPWVLLGLLESAFFALLGAGLAVAQRWRGWPLWAATLWVAQEALRDRVPWGGFPWGRLAFGQANGPLLPVAAVGGAPLLTFATALTGTALAAVALRAWTGPRRWRPLAIPAATVVLVPLVGLALSLTVHSGDSAPHRTIAVVQGNVPRLGLDFNAQREAVLRNHVDQTLELARRIAAGRAPQPELVVWPENASDIDPLANPDARALIDRAARAVSAPILVGAILDGPGEDHDRNAGILWDPTTGPGQTYLKRHPVPFAEYMPLRSLARKVTAKADLVPRDMTPGRTVGALHVGGLTIGDVICFEVAYDGLVRSDVTHGAQVLVTQTNNATFGRTDESPQQVAIARVRAVEHNRTNLVASTSGISAVIGPDGKILAKTDIFTSAILDRPVPIQSGRTLATRLGELPEWVLTAIGVASVGAVWVAQARTRRSTRTQRDGSAGADEREKETV